MRTSAHWADRDAAVRALTRSLTAWAGASPGEWTAAERERARRLAVDTYRDEAWIRCRRAADPPRAAGRSGRRADGDGADGGDGDAC